MVTLYLDQDEVRLMNHGFSFTGARKPIEEEGLVTPISVSENDYNMRDSGRYVVCSRKDGQRGNFREYVRTVEKEAGVPENERQIFPEEKTQVH